MSRPDRRKASMILSGLVVTDDAGLKGFRDLRAADPELDPELLKRARDILDHVYDAISAKDAEAWSRLSDAWRVLESVGDSVEPQPQAEAPDKDAPAVDAAHESQPRSVPEAPQRDAEHDDDVAPPPSIGSILAGEGVKLPSKREAAKASPWVSPSRAATMQGMGSRPPSPGQPPVASQPPAPPPVASQVPAPPRVASQAPAPVQRPSDRSSPEASQPEASEPERVEPAPASQPTMALPAELVGAPPVPSGPGERAASSPSAPEDVNQMTMSADGDPDPDYMAFALPFKEGAAAAPPGLMEGEQNEPFGETMSVGTLAAGGAVLPPGFREKLRRAAEEEAAREETERRARSIADEDRTALHDIEVPTSSPLPFAGPAKNDAPGLAESGPEPTVRISPAKMPAPERAEPSPPAPPSLPSHLAAMTIEQYAALCAECSVHAEWADQISATRYNVRDRSERELLDAAFRARMDADPELAARWRSTYARVEEWAKQQRARGGS